MDNGGRNGTYHTVQRNMYQRPSRKQYLYHQGTQQLVINVRNISIHYSDPWTSSHSNWEYSQLHPSQPQREGLFKGESASDDPIHCSHREKECYLSYLPGKSDWDLLSGWKGLGQWLLLLLFGFAMKWNRLLYGFGKGTSCGKKWVVGRPTFNQHTISYGGFKILEIQWNGSIYDDPMQWDMVIEGVWIECRAERECIFYCYFHFNITLPFTSTLLYLSLRCMASPQ